nr:E3 ubiquitin-protein ligase UPL1-like isoform X1 [Tanacetum cinerariifolium]
SAIFTISGLEARADAGPSTVLSYVVSGNPPLPLGAKKLLPFIEAFLVLYDKLQENRLLLQQDNACATESKFKQSITSSSQSQTTEGTVTFIEKMDKEAPHPLAFAPSIEKRKWRREVRHITYLLRE